MSERLEVAPDVIAPRLASVGGLETIRVICQETGSEDDEVRWFIGPAVVAAAPPGVEGSTYAIIGDLSISEGGWFVGASTYLRFTVPESEPAIDAEAVDGAAELVRRYGPWATHLLWDHTATVARSVSSLLPGGSSALHVPYLTPSTEYMIPVESVSPSDEGPGDEQ